MILPTSLLPRNLVPLKLFGRRVLPVTTPPIGKYAAEHAAALEMLREAGA